MSTGATAPRVLVLGASGFIGLNTIDALGARGISALAGRRARSNVIPLRSRKCELVLADASDPRTLDSALAGIDVLVHAAAHYPKLSLDRDATLRKGREELEVVFDAVARSSVRRVVFVSSTATVAESRTGCSDESDVFAEPPGFGVYHDLKWHLEDLALRENRFEVRVACPSACLGPWDLRVGTSALIVATARSMNPPHPEGWVSWVDARDVGASLAELCVAPSAPKRLILSAGSRKLHSFLVELAHRYQTALPSEPLSNAEALALAHAEELRAAREKVRPRLSLEIAELTVYGVRMTGTRAESTLGLRYRTLSETLDAFDEWARRMSILPPSAQTRTSSP
ncbi:MAG: NAD-dependent epimerase/dehydratase family protein [Deltaproteobacteria bacterium]|nr:NAD-dependent epimerase/dehydratase family protein [Deltaproteobacteria bacterium]